MFAESLTSLSEWLVIVVIAIAIVAYLFHWLYRRSTKEYVRCRRTYAAY